jgi:CubicO group peptidase (beta-lactamase class C family)
MADLAGELLWVPLGAEHDAEVTCDALGAAMHDGGICATTVDLARFGMMLLDGGLSGSNRVVPRLARRRLARGSRPPQRLRRLGVRPQVPRRVVPQPVLVRARPRGVVLLCLDINGQMVYVDPATGMMAAKVSSWPVAQSPAILHNTLAAFDAVGAALSGRHRP